MFEAFNYSLRKAYNGSSEKQNEAEAAGFLNQYNQLRKRLKQELPPEQLVGIPEYPDNYEVENLGDSHKVALILELFSASNIAINFMYAMDKKRPDKTELNGLKARFEDMVNITRELQGFWGRYQMLLDNKPRVETLVANFEEGLKEYDAIAQELGLSLVKNPIDELDTDYAISYLDIIGSFSEQIVSKLNTLINSPSSSEKSNLTALYQEVEDLEKNIYDDKLIKNAKLSISLLEERTSEDALGSALISGRIISGILDKINEYAKKNDFSGQEKIPQAITKLHDNKLIVKDKDVVINEITKADKKYRNLFSHDYNEFPSYSEAMSMITDTINLISYLAGFLNSV